jgi:anthranilate synthase component 1
MKTAHHRTVLTRELPGDLDTPVGAYLKLANRPYTYLLESVQGGERWGRYSFIGLASHEVLSVRGRAAEVRRNGKVVERAQLDDTCGAMARSSRARSSTIRWRGCAATPRACASRTRPACRA